MANLRKNFARSWSCGIFLLIVALLAMAVLSDVFVLTVDPATYGSAASGASSVAGGAVTFSYGFNPQRFSTLQGPLPDALIAQAIMLAACFVLPVLPVLAASLVLAGVYALLLVQHVVYAGTIDTDYLSDLFVCLVALYLGYLILRWLMLAVRKHRVDEFLRHHVPDQLVTHYMENPDEIGVVGDSLEMTILFCDIKRFTAISERLDPETLSQWLNRYFDAVSGVVVRHGGTIDKYMGDSVMAFWGAPAASDRHAADALMASREILLEVEALSNRLQQEQLPPISVGIGVSTGNANVGHLGSKYRMTYTVVGDAVNTADRLQRCTGYYDRPLIVNDAVTESVPDYLFRELDTVHVKGRQRFVRIFEPVCHEQEALPNTHRQLQMHRKAMQFYRRGMWADAEALFNKLSEDTGEINFYRKYIDRLVDIQSSQLKDGGTHVVDFTQKIG
ncbi:hypothetical protein AB833_30685 [Chromatiales bacterium (ex Bugula neritina AB1)]|nr:hypothetical protein AB833_30685 [Chromatiales bacterium (ex Bugula neritina AB1)]